MINVLVVCLGNICRSPTAEAVLRARIQQKKLDHLISVDSAGTASWHTGKSPDNRSQIAAARRGYDMSYLRARQIVPADFEKFDWILAADHQNLADILALKQSSASKGNAEISLYLDQLQPGSGLEIPDPYYGGESGFEDVLDLCEQAADAWIKQWLT